MQVSHPAQYDPTQLFPISRDIARAAFNIDGKLPFYGEDVWNAYELSWLSPGGIPRVAIACFRVPAMSAFIVESKSVKLYLNSLNQSHFASAEDVCQTIKKDLSQAVGHTVAVDLILPEYFDSLHLSSPTGLCIDSATDTTDCYEVKPEFLCIHETRATERLYSRLLRTRCPVTNQPDWATVTIEYSGPAIDHAGLLRYLVSFREHNGFHENCVEKIFLDITQHCTPDRLLVQARFTRRGGIDINPVRASYPVRGTNLRLANQ